MSNYYSKFTEQTMNINTSLETRLACGALFLVITNIGIIIAIIVCHSHDEECAKRWKAEGISPRSRNSPSISDYPWMLAFIILPDQIFSGTAIIISKKWAITTAYCIKTVAKYPISMMGFRGGSSFWNKHGFYHYVDKIIVHKKFNSSTLDYNVALVKVMHPFLYANEAPVALSRIEFKDSANVSELVGWATVSKNSTMILLLHIEVNVLQKKHCNEALRRIQHYTSDSVCAYKKATESRIDCNFFTGSALMVDGYLMGIISLDVMCSGIHLPGVYVNLITVMDWIQDIIIL